MRWKTCWIPLALLVLVAQPAVAQDWAGRGRLQGEVTDQTGEPIEGATIKLWKEGYGQDAGPDLLTTNKRGKWSYLGLGGGAWNVLVEHAGMVPSEGTVSVNEFGPNDNVRVQLRPIPEEELVDEAAIAAKAALEEGNALLRAGDYATARTKYEGAMADLDAEYHPMILSAIAQTHLGENNAAQAVTVLQQALATQPGDADLLRALARAQYMAEDVDASIATLEKVLAETPDDVETLKLVIDLLVRAGREEEAQSYMARLPEGVTVSADTRLNTGISLYNEGKLDEALAQFEAAVAENPDQPDVYYYRGLIYVNKQRNPEAIADFKKLLELDPDNPRAGEAQEFLKYLEQ